MDATGQLSIAAWQAVVAVLDATGATGARSEFAAESRNTIAHLGRQGWSGVELVLRSEHAAVVQAIRAGLPAPAAGRTLDDNEALLRLARGARRPKQSGDEPMLPENISM